MADLLYYGSSFGSGFGSGFLSGLRDILLAAVGVLIISIILAIVLYIFQALSLYTMAERRGLPNPWLAWIPIASIYTLGSVTDDINRRGGKNTVYRWLLLAGNILVFMPVFINLTFVRVMSSLAIWGINLMVAVAVMVLSLIAYYIIYKDHSESAVGFLVLSIFVAPAIPFILFSMRNKEAHSLGGGHGGGQRQIGGYYGGGQPAAGGGPAYGGGGGRGGKVVGVSGMYKGAEFPIQSGEELLIGRDSAISHIIIDQGAENISRKHCGITYDPGNRLYHVTDYSSNGTFKEDGTRLLTNVTSALPIGSLIILGTRQTSFRLG